MALTYYRPHVSGLTIYAERLARGLARRGHDVTVLTSRYDPRTPKDELIDGVRTVRVPVLCRVSKGVVMPSFGWHATSLIRQHDVVSLHLPQFDAGGLALRGRWMRRPTVLTYQCDLTMPPGPLNALASIAIDRMNLLAGYLCDRIVTHTDDFAGHSPYLRRFAHKVDVIAPPAQMEPATAEAAASFRTRVLGTSRRPLIGVAARLAAEKGIQILLRALPRILEEYPGAQVVCAGPYRNVIGEQAYATRLQPLLDLVGDRWRFLGVIDDRDMPAFFSCLDVIVVPSLNSTEAFGMVQVEAMHNGVPAVVSDLPGVREPIRRTGMGETTPPGDSSALAHAVLRVLRHRDGYVKPRETVEAIYSTERTVCAYERLFDRLRDRVARQRV